MKKILCIQLVLFSLHLCAQDNYEIQVYGAATMNPGTTMFELHSNYTFNGEETGINGVIPTNHSLHETLEITQGISKNFELGFYLFTNYSPGYGYQVVGSHLRPRVRAPEEWGLPVGLSLSLEMGYQKKEYATETWSLEIRPIIDKQFGNLYLSFNPTLGVTIKGNDKTGAPAFEPNFKASYAMSSRISVGTEYYGDLGALNHFEPTAEQSHTLFAAIDLYVDPNWEINLGPGWGLTKATGGFIFKRLVGRRINWHRKPGKEPDQSRG